jgi:curved DNA-binding protein CbpA
MAKDYYQILGVSRTATPDEIKKAYRKAAHQHHPDKTGGDEARFKEVNEAYQVLGNAARVLLRTSLEAATVPASAVSAMVADST